MQKVRAEKELADALIFATSRIFQIGMTLYYIRNEGQGSSIFGIRVGHIAHLGGFLFGLLLASSWE
jgi:hypothetical protein